MYLVTILLLKFFADMFNNSAQRLAVVATSISPIVRSQRQPILQYTLASVLIFVLGLTQLCFQRQITITVCQFPIDSSIYFLAWIRCSWIKHLLVYMTVKKQTSKVLCLTQSSSVIKISTKLATLMLVLVNHVYNNTNSMSSKIVCRPC